MMTMESLEHRRLLSNITAAYAAGVLSITGDIHDDSFSITETRTAAWDHGYRLAQTADTLINLSPSFTTPAAVREIDVTLPGTANFHTVSLLGDGGSARTVRDVNITVTQTAALVLNVNGVDNAGGLTLRNYPRTAGTPFARRSL